MTKPNVGKGQFITVNIISSDSPFKDVKFTTVPIKPF